MQNGNYKKKNEDAASEHFSGSDNQTKNNPGTTTEYILNGSTILAQNTTYPGGRKETLNFYYSSDGKLLEIGYLKGDDNGNISKDVVLEIIL